VSRDSLDLIARTTDDQLFRHSFCICGLSVSDAALNNLSTAAELGSVDLLFWKLLQQEWDQSFSILQQAMQPCATSSSLAV